MADITLLSPSVPDSIINETDELAARFEAMRNPEVVSAAPVPQFGVNVDVPQPTIDPTPVNISNQPAPQVELVPKLQPMQIGNQQVDLMPKMVQQPKPEVQFASQPEQASKAAPAPVVGPEIMQGLGTYGAQANSLNAIANAQVQKAELEASAQAKIEDQINTQIENNQKIQQVFEQNFNSRMADMEALTQEMSTPEKVQSNRLWSNMGTAQKIGAGIAIALGGYGGALTGKGDNKALDIILKAIDRDVEEQKFNIKQKSQGLRDSANMSQTMLSNLQSKFSTDLQAEAALKALQLRQVQAKLAKDSGKYNNDQIKATAQYQIAELKRAEMAEIAKIKADMAQQAYMNGTGTDKFDPAMEARLPEAMQKMRKETRERSAPDGWEGLAKDREAATEFLKKVNEAQPAIEGVKRILALSQDLNRVTDIKKRAEVATEIQALIGQLRVPLTGPGAMTDRDIKMLQDTIGNPTKVLSLPSVQRAKLMTVGKKLETDLVNAAKATGFRRKEQVNIPMRNY